MSGIEKLRNIRNKVLWLQRVRPNTIVEPLYNMILGANRRVLIEVNDQCFYVDPLSRFASEVLRHGSFEEDVQSLFHKYLKSGQTYVDVGANEGIHCALAGQIVGPEGCILAIEPQERLKDILEIHIRLNHSGAFFIYQNTLGREDGANLVLNLAPQSANGGSSLNRRFAMGKQQKTTSISLSKMLDESGIQHVDCMKIDVEGHEYEVVESLIDAIGNGYKVNTIFIDYHASILQHRGLSGDNIHEKLIAAGYDEVDCSVQAGVNPRNGHFVYTF